jgi:large subunit ribosomal protein L1
MASKKDSKVTDINGKGGKRIRAARTGIDADRLYPLKEAVSLLKARAKTKFDETIDVAMNLGIDPTQSDQLVRGMVAMPNGLGKAVRVAVFAKGDKAEAAKKAGADLVGGDDLAEQISKGEINFDVCIASPDMMGVVGKIGKILGPKGLMPNPKLGTVTPDVEKAVKNAKAGQVEFKVEKAAIIHAGIGKASFSEQAIEENLRAFVQAVNKAKPSGVKGNLIKKISISSTMGPGIKLDLADVLGTGQQQQAA